MSMRFFLSGNVVHAFDEGDDPSFYEGMTPLSEDEAMQVVKQQQSALPTPKTCTPAQGLVALFALKSITEDNVLAAIGQIPDPVQQYTARIGYQRATTWERNSQTMQAMAQLLQLSEADLDALFAYAVEVQV